MASMLKTLWEEEKKKELFHPYNYWELELTFQKSNGQKFKGHIIVPTFAQLGTSTPPKTREIWKKRMEENRLACFQGTALPQPEPGKPWRYKTWEEVAAQKNHMQKFPFFITESIIEHQQETEVKPPLTNTQILKLGQKLGKGSQEQIQAALQELYLEGYITNPKSNNCNLFKKSVESLLQSAEKKGWDLEKIPREFNDEEYGVREKMLEAIRPTQWDKNPEEVHTLLAPIPTKELKSWLYKIIYTRAINSQAKTQIHTKTKNFALGPLYLSRKELAEKTSNSFFIRRETEMVAHMNVPVLIEVENTTAESRFSEQELLECTHIDILEKKTDWTQKTGETELFDLLASEGLGKRDHLRQCLAKLKEFHYIFEENNELKLTSQGKSLTTTLNTHFGQFLDQNYHRIITDALKKVEAGMLEEEEFLREWWSCFKTFLDEDIEPQHKLAVAV
jgi:DNA topoisomerase IA